MLCLNRVTCGIELYVAGSASARVKPLWLGNRPDIPLFLRTWVRF